MTPSPALSRGCVIQGLFARFPRATRSTDATVQKRNSENTVQPSHRRAGLDAFQVNLTQKTGGWPLPRDVQAKMEAALGASFSDVRIHVGPEASAIGAIAFTWGSDIHFAPGYYNPHTPHGQSLLGHELTHVVQQRAGRVSNPFGSGVAVVQDHALEAEADRLGRLAAESRSPDARNDTSPGSRVTSTNPGSNVVNRKVNRAVNYSVSHPQPNGSGWQIHVASPGAPQPVGSVDLTASENRVHISNLRVATEHRRHGLAGKLIDAAIQTARTHGYAVAQLEARPDSPADVSPGALVSMYQKMGFRMTGRSKRGSPLMERRT